MSDYRDIETMSVEALKACLHYHRSTRAGEWAEKCHALTVEIGHLRMLGKIQADRLNEALVEIERLQARVEALEETLIEVLVDNGRTRDEAQHIADLAMGVRDENRN